MYYIKDEYFFQEGMEFQVMYSDGMQECMHCHDCLEISYVDRGYGTYVIEDKTYQVQPGDFYVINHQERHMMIAEDEEMVVSVCIFEPKFIWDQMDQYDFLKPFYSRKTIFSNQIRHVNEYYQDLRKNIAKIFYEFAVQEKGWKVSIKVSMIQMVITLYRHYQSQNELLERESSYQSDFSKIHPVINYIHDNFQTAISLDDLAKEAALSRNYLCAIFKKTLGCTVFEYIERVRIDYATLLLETTALSVAEIAMKAGFHGVSYFNRVFKKGKAVAPNQYRKQVKNPFQ